MEEAILLYKDYDERYQTPLNALQIRGGCLTPVLVSTNPADGVPVEITEAVENCDGNYFDFCKTYAEAVSSALEANGVRRVFTFHPEKTIELIFHHGGIKWETPITNLLELFYPRPSIVTITEREAFNLDLLEQLTNCTGRPELAVVLFTKLII